MNFAPFTAPLSPAEVVAFTERFVLPTLEAAEKLHEAGRIVAGGPMLAAMGFTFIARTATAAELETMVTGLPLWARAQTRVVPLGTFAVRAAGVRERLAQARARAEAITDAAHSR